VYGFVDDPPQEPMLLVMERLHESLSSAYGSDPAHLFGSALSGFLQAGIGISFLHSQSPPILNRDIKPSNMLLSSSSTGRRLKMGDFGLSKSLADITASITSRTSRSFVTDASRVAVVGTVHYMSMEPKYSSASDVYAFGVVCWEMICMRLPYRHCVDQQDIKKYVRNGMREDFELEDAPDFHFPPALQAMIRVGTGKPPSITTAFFSCFCWRRTPSSARPSASSCATWSSSLRSCRGMQKEWWAHPLLWLVVPSSCLHLC
jgi:serine/threonine protein kinase